MTEEERWTAFARVILEQVQVNGEPALEFIERVMIALPSYPDPGPSDMRDVPGWVARTNDPEAYVGIEALGEHGKGPSDSGSDRG
jgi:hypothetical protein